MNQIKGRIWKFGDNINTDVIFPGKYTYTIKDKNEMAKHIFEDIDPQLPFRISRGDIIFAGKNFGCGSSREQATFAVKYAGISAVVAKSFARLYFRNAINAGLLAITCPCAVEALENGDCAEIDIAHSKIITSKGQFSFSPLDKSAMEMIEAGGLIPYTKKILGIS